MAPLPDCTGAKGEVKGVDCKKAKAKKVCPGNQLPTVKDGEEVNCIVKPLCSENPGMPVGECWAPGATLIQLRQDGTEPPATQPDAGEHITPLPACTGAKGEAAGVDCKKTKQLKGCPGNVPPTVGESEVANCRVLPLCSDGGSGDCFASPTGAQPEAFL